MLQCLQLYPSPHNCKTSSTFQFIKKLTAKIHLCMSVNI
ncbi:mCG147512 [Mus musculus]|nr:mCG147512 [Mus musculus]